MIVRDIYIDGKTYKIIIGRNANENDMLIKSSHPLDMWFHLSNVSSAHLVIKNKGDKIPKRYINEIASMLFEYNNKAWRTTNVIYTEIKNVKRTDVPGMVMTKNTKVIKF